MYNTLTKQTRYLSLHLLYTGHRSIKSLPPRTLTWAAVNPKISIRPGGLNDVTMILDWAKEEGWNPGLYEAKPFYYADPNGFRIVYVDEQPAGAVAVINYSRLLTYLGLFIVRPEFRGQGLGKILWEDAMQIAKGKTIALDAVKNQTYRYERSGFKVNTTNTHWVLDGLHSTYLPNREDASPTYLQPFQKTNFEELVHYDANIFFCVPRREFLKHWLHMPESRVVVTKDNEKNIITGYGVLSKSLEGVHIAPLFANTDDIARTIFHELFKYVPSGARVHLNSHDLNSKAPALLHELGFRPSFQTLRMYKGNVPKFATEKLFGLTTLDVG